MATIMTKYSIGDVVYFAGIETERRKHPCPDCLDTKQWKATSPAGGEYEFACPRCGNQYHAKHELSLAYSAYAPAIRRLTIGSVQFNSAEGAWDTGARYMCLETGVGSGQVYNEAKLHPTEEGARAAAEAEAAAANSSVEWVVKLYNQSLEVCDYQLGDAALRKAGEVESRARSLLWNINDLFATIEDAADIEAVKEAVSEYKDWYWKSDLAAVRDRDGSPKGGDSEAGSVRSTTARTSEGGIAND